MPTYHYRCAACENRFDAFQKFADDPLTDCPECGGSVRRVIQPVGVVFKGSGWYINDSRKAPAETSTESSTKSAEPTTSDKAKSSETADTKPVAAKAESKAAVAAAAD